LVGGQRQSAASSTEKSRSCGPQPDPWECEIDTYLMEGIVIGSVLGVALTSGVDAGLMAYKTTEPAQRSPAAAPAATHIGVAPFFNPTAHAGGVQLRGAF
jgi:hypothetical protein